MAHTDPAMCRLLVDRLAAVGPVHLHVNALVDDAPFADVAARPVTDRVAVKWGHWSLVEAVLRLSRQALEDPDVDAVTWVSGQHYPLVDPRVIAAAEPVDRLPLWPLPDASRGKPEWRFTTRFLPVQPPGGRADVLTHAVLRRLPPIDYRRILGPHRLYGGTAWWSLTRRTLEEMLAFLEQEDEIRRYFQRIVVPDESVFHTAVGAVLARRAAEEGVVDPDPTTMTLGSTTYVRWKDRPHPEDLDADAIRAAAQEGWWFARKFSTQRPDLVEVAESCW